MFTRTTVHGTSQVLHECLLKVGASSVFSPNAGANIPVPEASISIDCEIYCLGLPGPGTLEIQEIPSHPSRFSFEGYLFTAECPA